MTLIAEHFPEGCWHQPGGTYAGSCACGASFDGATYAEAKAAWAAHATPANGEQVERDKLKTAYLALLTISQEDDGPLGRYAAKIARAVEPDATPTEDARSRVKVLEEALREVIDFAEVPNMSLSSDYYRGARMAWDVTAEIARTALGNKETDRHG